MVAKKTKVLLAMLSLDDFTVEELSRFSGVVPATVKTVVDRHFHSLEKTGTEPTHRRGGQPIRYRLTSSGREELAKIAKATREALAATSPTFMESIKARLPLSESDTPLGLRLAGDTLNRLVPQAENRDDQLVLLEAAKREAQSARRAASDAGRPTQMKIERAVKEVLENIEKARVEIERPAIPAYEPLFAEAAAIGFHVWSGVALKSSFPKRVAAELKDYGVSLSKVPTDPAPSSDISAVILLVDSGNSKKAMSLFHHALDLSTKVEKPMVVFDKGYDPEFRNHVYAAGVTHFCNDAIALNGVGMRGLVSDLLPPIQA